MNGATRSEHSRSVTSCNSKRDPLEQPLGFSPFASALADTISQLSDKLEARRAQDTSCLHCERFKPIPLANRGVFCSFRTLLLLSGSSAACRAQSIRWVAAKVSTQVESQHRLRPPLKGKAVRPSGRRPSDLSSPTGSNHDGMFAAARARLTTSFRLA